MNATQRKTRDKKGALAKKGAGLNGVVTAFLHSRRQHSLATRSVEGRDPSRVIDCNWFYASDQLVYGVTHLIGRTFAGVDLSW